MTLRTVLILTILLLTGCATTYESSDNTDDGLTGSGELTNAKGVGMGSKKDSIATQAMAKEYNIGVDDMVKVSVWKNPDLSVEVPVRPDGMITVPLIGDVSVGGKVPSEVAGIIRTKLSDYVREPQVTVIISQLNSHEFISRIRVTGAVEQPRSLPYRQGMTILDAVLESGGINKFASPNKTKLYRKKNGKSSLMSVKLKNILKKGDLTTNYDLLPGDVITVPERGF